MTASFSIMGNLALGFISLIIAIICSLAKTSPECTFKEYFIPVKYAQTTFTILEGVFYFLFFCFIIAFFFLSIKSLIDNWHATLLY